MASVNKIVTIITTLTCLQASVGQESYYFQQNFQRSDPQRQNFQAQVSRPRPFQREAQTQHIQVQQSFHPPYQHPFQSPIDHFQQDAFQWEPKTQYYRNTTNPQVYKPTVFQPTPAPEPPFGENDGFPRFFQDPHFEMLFQKELKHEIEMEKERIREHGQSQQQFQPVQNQQAFQPVQNQPPFSQAQNQQPFPQTHQSQQSFYQAQNQQPFSQAQNHQQSFQPAQNQQIGHQQFHQVHPQQPFSSQNVQLEKARPVEVDRPQLQELTELHQLLEQELRQHEIRQRDQQRQQQELLNQQIQEQKKQQIQIQHQNQVELHEEFQSQRIKPQVSHYNIQNSQHNLQPNTGSVNVRDQQQEKQIRQQFQQIDQLQIQGRPQSGSQQSHNKQNPKPQSPNNREQEKPKRPEIDVIDLNQYLPFLQVEQQKGAEDQRNKQRQEQQNQQRQQKIRQQQRQNQQQNVKKPLETLRQQEERRERDQRKQQQQQQQQTAKPEQTKDLENLEKQQNEQIRQLQLLLQLQQKQSQELQNQKHQLTPEQRKELEELQKEQRLQQRQLQQLQRLLQIQLQEQKKMQNQRQQIAREQQRARQQQQARQQRQQPINNNGITGPGGGGGANRTEKPIKSVRDLFNTTSCIDPPLTCPHPRIHFYLYTRSTQNNPDKIDVTNPDSIRNTPFNPRHPVKMLVHGFQGGRQFSPSTDLRKAYFTRGDYNIFVVDYNSLVRLPCLSQIQWSPSFLALCVSQLIGYVGETYTPYVPPNRFHLIGYSIGAHIAGLVANYIPNGKLGRITGLDPTIIFYQGSNRSHDLDPSDAHFIDVIHTGAGILGQRGPNGHVDYYVNGGTTQPGCQSDSLIKTLSCDHTKVSPYFVESIITPVGFWALPCPNLFMYVLGFCHPKDEDYILMGEDAPHTARGIYYLSTNANKPYAKGFPGKRMPIKFPKWRPS